MFFQYLLLLLIINYSLWCYFNTWDINDDCRIFHYVWTSDTINNNRVLFFLLKSFDPDMWRSFVPRWWPSWRLVAQDSPSIFIGKDCFQLGCFIISCLCLRENFESFQDRPVYAAPADFPHLAVVQLVHGWLRVVQQQSVGRDNYPRGVITTLHGVASC